MYALKAFTLLAVAGSAVAAPQQGWKNWGGSGYWRGGNSQAAASTTVSAEVAVATTYTTVTGSWSAWSSATPTVSATAMATASAAKTTAVSASATPTASSSTGSYMDVVSEWRSKMGLSALTEDSTLQGNSLKTVQDGNGQMVHELNPGSFAQVLAPGTASDFENVFVGGWLCERPDLPGLDGICSTMSAGWSYGGETGHADILTSTSYSKIGCALADGIWGCDLA